MYPEGRDQCSLSLSFCLSAKRLAERFSPFEQSRRAATGSSGIGINLMTEPVSTQTTFWDLSTGDNDFQQFSSASEKNAKRYIFQEIQS